MNNIPWSLQKFETEMRGFFQNQLQFNTAKTLVFLRTVNYNSIGSFVQGEKINDLRVLPAIEVMLHFFYKIFNF
jgi:hypothetical protein